MDILIAIRQRPCVTMGQRTGQSLLQSSRHRALFRTNEVSELHSAARLSALQSMNSHSQSMSRTRRVVNVSRCPRRFGSLDLHLKTHTDVNICHFLPGNRVVIVRLKGVAVDSRGRRLTSTRPCGRPCVYLRSFHQATAAARWKMGRVRPGAAAKSLGDKVQEVEALERSRTRIVPRLS